jgi:uncharacterized protein YraI
MKRLAITVVLSLLLAVIAVSPAGAQAANLLQDPGFEGATYNFVSADPEALAVTYSTPSGWGGGVALDPRSQPWMNRHPTGFPHFGPYKRNGYRSFHMSRGFATFTASVYQQVSVQPNTDVQGGAWAFIENGSGTAIVRAGIDPNGGTSPFSPSVVWSGNAGAAYQWNQVAVNARASGSVVTLFLFATQSSPSDPNGVYWDDAFLYGAAGSGDISSGSSSGGGSGGIVASPTVRLSVRTGPGTSFRRLGVISPGENYAVLSQRDDGWVEIRYGDQNAYVFGQFVTISQGQASGGGSGGAGGGVAGTTLNFTLTYTSRMRAAPTQDSATLTRIPYTTTVQATGRTGDANWVRVVYAGQTGWVAAWLGRFSGDVTTLPVVQ